MIVSEGHRCIVVREHLVDLAIGVVSGSKIGPTTMEIGIDTEVTPSGGRTELPD